MPQRLFLGRGGVSLVIVFVSGRVEVDKGSLGSF